MDERVRGFNAAALALPAAKIVRKGVMHENMQRGLGIESFILITSFHVQRRYISGTGVVLRICNVAKKIYHVNHGLSMLPLSLRGGDCG